MTTEINIDKIIERVQKLLALAGNNSNENEAAAAIEKAHAILADHNLSMATVEEHAPKGEDDDRGALASDTNFSEIYFRQIWNAVGDLNYCKMFSTRPNPRKRKTVMTLVGRKVNTIIAAQLATYLCQTMIRLSNEAAKASLRTDFAFKNAFLAGCAVRLCQRIRDMKKKDAATGSGNALVLWSGREMELNTDFIAKSLGLNLVSRKSRQRPVDSQGYHAGHSAADRISFNQQLGKGEATRLIA